MMVWQKLLHAAQFGPVISNLNLNFSVYDPYAIKQLIN